MSFWRAMARGFTLIEMAIVLVVIGLILSGGLMAVTPVLQSSRVTETNGKLDRIENALLLYGIQNTCLPCPATGSIATGAANYGAARHAAGYYTSGCATASNLCVATAGVVPWLNLGLSEEDITDAWGNRISYQLSSGTTTTCSATTPLASRNNNLQLSGGFARNSTLPSCYPYGTLAVNTAAGGAIVPGTAGQEGAAFVLVSHGPDGQGAWAAQSGIEKTESGSNDDQEDNADDATPFVQSDRIEITGQYFDDVVRWRTAPMMIQLCGINACGNPA
jgi:prepilin-type N-terminal cleavage/methylation domain-containing protein